MALTETPGSTSITGISTEIDLFNTGTVTLNQFWSIIFVQNASMASGDTMIIKVYVRDANSGTSDQLLYTWTITGSQTTAIFIPPVASTQYRVSMQSTAGSTRIFNWAWYKL